MGSAVLACDGMPYRAVTPTDTRITCHALLLLRPSSGLSAEGHPARQVPFLCNLVSFGRHLGSDFQGCWFCRGVQIAAGDVKGICRARLKADAAAVLDPSDRQAAAAVVRGLQRVAEEAEASGYGFLTGTWTALQ